MPKWCPTQKKVQAVSHTSIEILADAPDVAAERSSAVADYNSPHPVSLLSSFYCNSSLTFYY